MKSKKQGGTTEPNPGVCKLLEDAAAAQGVSVYATILQDGRLEISGCDYGSYLIAKSLAVKDFYFSPTLISYAKP